MWLRSRPSRPSMRPMSWNSSKTMKARNPPAASRRSGGSGRGGRAGSGSRAGSRGGGEGGVEGGERVARRIELESRTDAEGAEREADPRALEERLHLPAQIAA